MLFVENEILPIETFQVAEAGFCQQKPNPARCNYEKSSRNKPEKGMKRGKNRGGKGGTNGEHCSK